MNVKAKGINENVVAGIKYKQYKNGLCDQKYLRHEVSKIQSKYHRKSTQWSLKKIISSSIDNLF